MGLRGIHIKTCVVLALSLFMAGNAAASDFDDMVAAERAFAADASARSTREAFLAALANDGLVFLPGPTSGQRTWTDRAPDKNHLEWAPAMAEIAKGGDLGYPSTVELADGTLLTVWYESMKEPKLAVLRQAKWKLG